MKKYCKDCGEECDKRAKRCRKCHTDNVLNKSPNRGKNKRAPVLPPNFCVGCGKKINYDSKRCNKCHPKWLATQKSWLEGNKERTRDFWDNVDEEWYEEWKAANKEASQKRLNDPEWWKAWRKGMSLLNRGTSKLEERFSELLEEKRINHRRNVQIGPYEVDILIGKSFVIELNGDYWHNLPGAIERDRRRNDWIRSLGYTVYVIWESEFYDDPYYYIRKVQNMKEGPLVTRTLF